MHIKVLKQVRDVVSYVLKQDKICVVLTTPLNSKSNINDHIVKHGDGVKVIALWVDDATKSWRETTSRAKSYMKPTMKKMSMVRSYDLEYSLWRNSTRFCRAKKI